MQALDKVAYLEAVKRGLDRFVPDTVRRLIEENPVSPALQKSAKDVTILFLDIQGYTVLSDSWRRRGSTKSSRTTFPCIFLTSAPRGEISTKQRAMD
jgi:hypothetical protein